MATVTTSIGTALGSAGNGVVTLTSGSTSVTGLGTDFTSKFTGGTAPPQAVEIPIGGGTYYTVKSVESDTALTLVSDPGVSASSQSWKVGTRDYSTIAAWDADLDNSSIYSSGDTAVGECYNDTTFSISGSTDIDGGSTIGLDNRILTAAAGERHDGTANSGVRLLCTNTSSDIEFLLIRGPGSTSAGGQIEWLEIDCNEKKMRAAVRIYGSQGIQNCLVHGARWTGSNNETVAIKTTATAIWVCNNIIYDINGNNGSSSGNGTRGIYLGVNDWVVCVNNTVYGVITNSSAGLTFAYGIQINNGDNYQRIYNNIAMGTASDNGTATDFVTQTSTSYTDANYSSDTSAPGNTNYRSESAADTFVSIDTDSEDFHLKAGANAIGEGRDAGTSEIIKGRTMPYPPNTWNVDIDGRDRDAEGDTWDIGAAQFVASAAAQTGKSFLLFMD